ncbi:hypothetical protein DFH08DRAFT_951487 [Mycena albidolilacea]|uniref:Uncharacterized protein n=1 Tax=Mycena albidolilacea TaxID=1033008 RepID=A0AAD7F0W0_9AGAR|nr:hypothetical protein DFH08DRAFT_951487 [Mycena albidolilacea]
MEVPATPGGGDPYAAFDTPEAHTTTAAHAAALFDADSPPKPSPVDSVQMDSDLADNPGVFEGLSFAGDLDYVYPNPSSLEYPDPFAMDGANTAEMSAMLSGLDYEDDDEDIDELSASQPATPNSFPVTPNNPVAWATRVQPALPQKQPLFDPLRTPDAGDSPMPDASPMDSQVGGGRRRSRSATPPEVLPATRFRQNPRPSEKASPCAYVSAANRRAPPGAVDPIAYPAAVQPSAAPVQPPPAPVQPPPAPVQPLPAPVPAAKSKTAPKPAIAPAARSKPAPKVPRPRPVAKPAARKFVPDPNSSLFAGGSKSGGEGSKSGGASEPGAALESGGDLPTAKGKGKRVEFAPSPAFNISSPAQFRGVLNDFLDANNFEEQPLPPPPVGYRAPEVSNDADADAGGDVDAGSDADAGGDVDAGSDADANTGACGDDPQCPPPQRGRFSAAQKKALTDCFASIEEAVATCALSANLPASRVVNAYTRQREGANTRTNNGWNLYQTFAQSTPQQRLLERRRVDPAYKPPKGEETPLLTAQQVLDGYSVFKGKFSKEQMDAVLMTAAELAKNEAEQDQTLRQRQARYAHHFNKLKTLLEKICTQDSFEALLIFIGPNVNEDAELGGIISTKGLKTFVEDIASTEGDLLAAAKLTAYTSNMKGLQLVNIPSSSASAAAMAATAREPPASPDPPESPAPDAPSDKKGQGKATQAQKVASTAHRDAVRALRTRLGEICIADLGVNVFEKDNGDFGLHKAAGELAANNSILTNWPADVRLPHLYPKNKALSALRLPEIRSLNEAMDARETAGQGLRFELMKEPYTTGGYTIFTHDYRNYTPPGPSSAPASVKHWRSSSGAILPCSNGENVAYEVHYDLRNPLPRQIISTGELVTKSTSTRYAPPAPPKAKAKAKKSKSKGGKGKRKAVSEDDDESEQYEPEEEEPTSPHLKKKQRPNPSSEFVPHLEPPPEPAPPITRAQSRAPVQEGGGAPPARVRSQRRAAIAANKVIGEDEDMSDDDHPIAMSKTSRSSRVRPRTVDSSESESERPAVRRRQVFDHVSIPPSPVRDAPTTRHCDAVRDDRHVYDNAGQPLGMAYETEERGRYEIQWTVPPVASSSRHPAASSSSMRPPPPAASASMRPPPVASSSSTRLTHGGSSRGPLLAASSSMEPPPLASSSRPTRPPPGASTRPPPVASTRPPPAASTRPPPAAPTRPPPVASRGPLLAAPSSMEPPSVASSSRPTRPPPAASSSSTRPPPGASSSTRPPPGASSASTRAQLDGSSSKKPVPHSRRSQATAPPSAHAEIPDRGPRPSLPGIATINDEVPMQRSSSPGPAEAEAQSAEAPDPTSEMMRLLGSMTPQQMQAMLGMMAQASQAAPQ